MRQPAPSADDTRGILRPDAGLRRFALERLDAPDDLSGLVEWIWTVKWNLPSGVTHQQETLPAPCVHLVAEQGAWNVHGPGTERFKTTLRGRAFATGVRFTPAGFFAFSALPLKQLVDAVKPAQRVLKAAIPPPAKTPKQAVARVLALLRAAPRRDDENIARVNALVALTQRDVSILRVEGLAKRAGVSPRSLHRLFEKYVGVGSKWIVRRARVMSAAERVKRGERVDWAQVAQELGYSDQAHLIRDFRAQIGLTPAAYARKCAEGPPSGPARPPVRAGTRRNP